MFRPKSLVLILLVLAPAALRVVDHPWNLAPIGALALFVGAYFRDRIWAFTVPLLAMLLSDIALGVTRGNMDFWTFHAMIPVVYGCYALSVALGLGVRRTWNALDRHSQVAERADDGDASARARQSAWRFGTRTLPVAAATLAGSVLFFIVTNFAVWAFFPTYPKSWHGLLTCYEAAVPFFRTTLAGDVVYVVVLFGGYALLKHRLPVLQESGLLHAH